MITRVQALHYKGLKYIDITMKPFTLLTGENGSGKSSFLDIFRLVQDILTKDPLEAINSRSSDFSDLVWKKEKNDFEIALELQIPQDEKFHLARYEISLRNSKTRGVIIEKENLYLKKRKSNSDRETSQEMLFPQELKIPEYIVSPPKKTYQGWRKIISKAPGGNDYFHSETTDWTITYRFGATKTSLARISEDETCFPITLWIKKAMTEGIRFLELNEKSIKTPFRASHSSELQPDGANLAEVIKFLKEKHHDHYQKWLENIKTILTDVEDIEIKEREEDRALYIYAKLKGNLEIPSYLLSDGAVRVMAWTLIPYLQVKDRVYLIEEPENGLDPPAIKNVFASLLSVSGNQILMTTHSPLIVDLARSEEILRFSKNDTGAVEISGP